MSIELNRDFEKRDEIIFGEYDENTYGMGGIRDFDCMNFEVLARLLALKFIDPDDKQNDCPSVKEIFEFMAKYPIYTTHGYAITPNRNDYRVSLRGVEKNSCVDNADELEDFMKLFKHADDFEVSNTVYCWFD